MAAALQLNRLRPKLFVEPFAGGASVALQLLNDDLVEAIGLAERDPLVASFWKVVFHDTEWLVRRIKTVKVDLRNWTYFRQSSVRSRRERALACIFLNRTSFSGILAPSAGPIGGQTQRSTYAIDCRFARDTLVQRVRQAAQFRDRVLFVESADWSKTVSKVESMRYREGDVFYYLDPPFYHKADRLYRFYFTEDDHLRLRDALARVQHPWLLSYDSAEAIRALYRRNGCGRKRVELLYSAAAKRNPARVEELVISNLPKLPKETRLWRTGNGQHAPDGASRSGNKAARRDCDRGKRR